MTTIVEIGRIHIRSTRGPIPPGWAELTVPVIHDADGDIDMVALSVAPYLRPKVQADRDAERAARRTAKRLRAKGLLEGNDSLSMVVRGILGMLVQRGLMTRPQARAAFRAAVDGGDVD